MIHPTTEHDLSTESDPATKLGSMTEPDSMTELNPTVEPDSTAECDSLAEWDPAGGSFFKEKFLWCYAQSEPYSYFYSPVLFFLNTPIQHYPFQSQLIFNPALIKVYKDIKLCYNTVYSFRKMESDNERY